MNGLHNAVLANSLEIVELLVKHSLDVNSKNFEEMTPIKYKKLFFFYLNYNLISHVLFFKVLHAVEDFLI